MEPRTVAVLVAAALAAGCAAAGPQPARAGADPGTELRLRLEPGEVRYVEHEVARSMPGGGLLEVSASAVLTTLEPTAADETCVRLELLRVRARLNGAVVEEHDPARVSVRLVLSPAARVRGAPGLEAGEAAAASLAVGMIADLAESLVALPARPVAPGAAWSSFRSLPRGPELVALASTHRLTELGPDGAVVRTEGRLAPDAAAAGRTALLQGEARGMARVSLEDGLPREARLSIELRAVERPENWGPGGVEDGPTDDGDLETTVLLVEERVLRVSRAASSRQAAPAGPLGACGDRLAAFATALAEAPVAPALEWVSEVALPEGLDGRLVEDRGPVLVLRAGDSAFGAPPWAEEDEPVGAVEDLAADGIAEAERSFRLADLTLPALGRELPVVYLAMPARAPVAAVRARLDLLARAARLRVLVRAPVEVPVEGASPEGASPAVAAAIERAARASSPAGRAAALRDALEAGAGACALRFSGASPVHLRGATAGPASELLAGLGACRCRVERLEDVAAVGAAWIDARRLPWRWVELPLTDDPAAPRLGLPAAATVADLARALAGRAARDEAVRW